MAKGKNKGGAGVNVGTITQVNESADRQVKALTALIERAKRRPPVPAPADPDDAPEPDHLAAKLPVLEQRTAELKAALVASRDAVGAAASTKKLTAAELVDGKAKLEQAYSLFVGLSGLHPEVYGAAFGHGFPHQKLGDIGAKDADLRASVERIHGAIGELPEAKRGALQELLEPLAQLDARFKAGAASPQAAYQALQRAIARATRAEHQLHRAAELQYVDNLALVKQVFPTAPAPAPKAKPAPTPAPPKP